LEGGPAVSSPVLDRCAVCQSSEVLYATGKEGTLVAKVDHGKVALTRVMLGRDFGKELEVLDGIKIGEELIVNPSDELETGHAVDVLPQASEAKL
jgi:hypothetical protein